jgi:integrase
MVRQILLNAKQQGAMPYAIAYLLFATGIKVEELVKLRRQDILVREKAALLRISKGDRAGYSEHLSEHLLENLADNISGHGSEHNPELEPSAAETSSERVVPINSKVMGHRYGSVKSNPLATYLKNRKDDHEAMFLVDDQRPLQIFDVQKFWLEWVRDFRNPDGSEILIQQVTPNLGD